MRDPLSIADGETIETAFAHLEECLERFLAIAPIADAGLLADTIPDIAPDNQRLILIELIKVDMAMAAEVGLRRNISFYLPHLCDRLASSNVPLDLVLEEVQLRREAGETPDVEEYVAAYAHLAVPLREMMAPRESTVTNMRLNRPPELALGSQIDDFTIVSELGRGAFATVYLARQESMQRMVALKVAVRCGSEPQALAQLDHPSIVRVYDQRVTGDPPVLLLYMQYLPGGTLADVVKLRNETPAEERTGRLLLRSIDRHLLAAMQQPPEQSPQRQELAQFDWPTAVAWIGVQLADGLGYAHERGVLHRDVKPANVLLSAEGTPKLADFNVSDSGLNGRAGAAAHFGGSLAYMSPEQLRVADIHGQLRADQLDGRADLYALAILLWELWQGRRPWSTPAVADSWSKAITHQVEARRQPPDTPVRSGTATERALEGVLRKTLSSDIQDRPRSGREMAGRLRLALNPEMAALFEPEPKSLIDRVQRLPVLITSAICILLPNGAAGRFNWNYNFEVLKQEAPQLVPQFLQLAKYINIVAYPFGTALLVWFSLEVARAMKHAEMNLPATEHGLSATWNLGTRAAILGGGVWMTCGLIYPLAMRLLSEDFSPDLAINFFVSLTICGGVAWTYPFFGLTYVAVMAYYPRLVSPSMSDPAFVKRSRDMRRKMLVYLASTALIPLLALTLMIMRHGAWKGYLLSTVAVTALGLFAAFYAYQRLETVIQSMGKVLDHRGSLEQN